MTILIGLTGSMGMGKSTTARMFAEAGCTIWDADAAVHRLYAPGGMGAAALAGMFPEVIEAGGVSRARLREIVAHDPQALARLEAVVHPLVRKDRTDFVQRARAEGKECVVLDIPLLFETGAERDVDVVVVASTPPEVQRARLLARGKMAEAELDAILQNQMPDVEKRARADHVIVTDTLEHAAQQVQAVLAEIRRKQHDARDRS